jgi:thiol-disulfide isomerase/thioredoxin
MMLPRQLRSAALLAVLVALFARGGNTSAAEEAAPENPFPNRVPAVELEGGVEWLNAAGPITLKELRGKVVILDFWTFCCINCMHVLPDLEFLEKKYGKELVVIGVHSAKFDNEKETGNIRKAILRYEIEHPVINDANMVVWRKFGVRAWPTLVLIDPEGFYCGYVSGEGQRELLDQVVGRVVAYHKAKGTLDESPVRFDLERNKQPATPLRFPGKILADEPGNRLFISDSNHNRIVIASLDGQYVDVIGSGAIGSKDGGYADAQFDHPQGMALVDDVLYVADTENHLLRAVDLKKKQVTTFAGTGEQGHDRSGTLLLRSAGLNSPWDLLALDGVLYVAMAGPHQIWSHQLGTKVIQPYAGSGREDIRNGELQESALAQPSGIATDGRNLFVVDSEGSAVRKITTKPDNNLKKPDGAVTTIAGASDLPGARSLFEFGDVDGTGGEARLQHPLGIAYHDGALFVADSYNHKLKQIDAISRKVTTWLGTGKPGDALDPPQFAEPAGLAIARGMLYVADTNNHRIVAIDLSTKQAKLLPLTGLTPPNPVAVPEPAVSENAVIKLEGQSVAPGKLVEFTIELRLPEGYKLNPAAAATYRGKAVGENTLLADEALGKRHEAEIVDGRAVVKLPVSGTGKATVQLTLTYAFCREGAGGLCKLGSSTWEVPLTHDPAAKATPIPLQTPAPKAP